MVGGPARFRGTSIMLIGHEKGADTASRVKHNFGMARPEGYRKAIRLMDMAERFAFPLSRSSIRLALIRGGALKSADRRKRSPRAPKNA
ncbi:MAG: hypothetical protein R3C60_12515 [Parvularculaceae bacterium]